MSATSHLNFILTKNLHLFFEEMSKAINYNFFFSSNLGGDDAPKPIGDHEFVR